MELLGHDCLMIGHQGESRIPLLVLQAIWTAMELFVTLWLMVHRQVDEDMASSQGTALSVMLMLKEIVEDGLIISAIIVKRCIVVQDQGISGQGLFLPPHRSHSLNMRKSRSVSFF